MVEIINSFEDLCRLCAGKIDILMGINIFESDNRQIFKKICECLPIQISVDDNFPKMVCVECACKLDLMFDFRERSILTAHLFSDMMTVNSGNVITVHPNIPLEGQSVEGDFNSDFMSCKLDPVKYNGELAAQVCSRENESILSENIILPETSDLLDKTKAKLESRIVQKNINNLQCTSNELDSQIKVPIALEKDISISTKAYLQSEDQALDRTLNSQNLSTSNLELESVNPNDINENINDCSGLDWFFCNICNRTFADKEEFNLHNREHLQLNDKAQSQSFGEEVLDAEVPANKKKKTKQKGEREAEKRVDGKVTLVCGKQYQTNHKSQERIKKQTGEKPFTCSYQECRKTFRSKIGLAQHEANHSGQFEFSCSTCGKGFQCKSYLVVHQRVHSDLKPYVCKQCPRKFKTKQSLLDHMNRHLGVKPYLCDICGRGFITKGLCKSHQKVHSGTDNRQYPCNVCRKLFVSKSYLNTHIRIHTGEKPFMCEVCGKSFLTRVDLRIHSTMHTGEKSFVCEMCGKAFARRDALRCHRRSHTGERPYKCEFCGQSFTQFSPMAIHKRLHTGERPYKCDVCHKAFVSRSTMLTHKKKHHAATNQESQVQLLTVEVPGQQEEITGLDSQAPQQLIVIENSSSQLLLTLSKRQQTTSQPSVDIVSLRKIKTDGLGLAAIE